MTRLIFAVPLLDDKKLIFLWLNIVEDVLLKTLVIYDISDDKRRTGLREHLRDYGLGHIQYSGFLGEMDPHDRHVLSKEVGRYLSSERDSIYIIPLCDRCLRLCNIISESKREMAEEEITILG